MAYLLVIAATFGVMFLLDKGLTKLFRSRDQHRSGTAVRLKKHYGILSLAMMALGALGIITFFADGNIILLLGGVLVLPGGAALGLYYLTHGIFYDDESFIYLSFGKKSVTYHYRDIQSQQLYNAQGNLLVELYMADGKSVHVHGNMVGAFDFLDKAFSGWCAQKGISAEDCPFYDPANSCWFPPVSEEK